MPEQFPAPSPIDVVHQSDTPILSILECAGFETVPVSVPEEAGPSKESSFEGRLEDLLREIEELPDTTSGEIQMNPNNPDHKVKLEDAMGWKLHLNFDSQNPDTVARISEVLSRIKQSGAVRNFKIGDGGGKEWDNPGKESTIYVGSRNKTDAVAKFVSRELGDVLLPPEGHALIDDIPLANNVMGRFAPQYDPEFHQYGSEGIPYLKEEFARAIWMPQDQQKEYLSVLAKKSLDRIVEKYGDYFTGTQEETLPVEGEVVIPRYDSANQVSVADLDDLYPDWREDHEGSDPELVLLWAIRRQESTRIADALQVSAESATGEGLERAVDQIPFDVGTHFDAHGIAGKFGMPSDELDALLKNGIDENRTFYSKSLDYSPEASGALGADRPFTEGDLIVVSGMDEMLVDGGIKYVLVGETYLKCFDLLRNRYPEVTFIPWHEAPDFFVDMVNGAENTKFVKNIIEYPNTFAIIPDASSLNYPVSKDESPVIINKDMPTDRDDVW